MGDDEFDDIDRGILVLLQEDARHNTNARISEQVGVSPSTVSNRISALEDRAVITGYRPEIDYERVAYPLRVLFVCTVPIPDRAASVRRVLELSGVVNVRELMTGEGNLHIEVVGEHHDDITRLATAIADIGITVEEVFFMKEEYTQPASVFEG